MLGPPSCMATRGHPEAQTLIRRSLPKLRDGHPRTGLEHEGLWTTPAEGSPGDFPWTLHATGLQAVPVHR